MNLTSKIFIFLFLLATILPAQIVQTMYFDRFTHYDIDDWITYAPATDITAVEVGDDYVYFGTRFGGILRYHLYEGYWDYPFTTSSGLRSNAIFKLSYDERNRKLYARNAAGIDVFDFGFNYWQPYDGTMPPPRQPLNVEVSAFKKDRRSFQFPPYYRPEFNELPDFFTGRQYLFRPPNEILDPYNRLFHIKAQMVADKFNRLWLATDGLGPAVASLTDNTLRILTQSLPNIYPHDVFFDGDDIWIGGLSNGYIPSGICLWKGNPESWQYFEAGLISGIYDHNIRAIAGKGRFVFFGSQQGLVRYDKKKKDWETFTRHNRLLSEEINDLFIFKNTLFIATDRGFNWMEIGYDAIQRSKNHKLNNIPVTRIAATDSSLLFATPYGIYQYLPVKDRLTLLKTGSSVLDVRIGAVGFNHDSLWFAGQNGVAFYDPATKSWQSFTQIRFKFYDMAFTPGIVWFATSEGLLKYVIQQNYWYLYTTRDGLAHNTVYRIDVDGFNLWLSTPSGVTVFRWYRPGRNE
ncbi:hypothetical protein Calab_0854 [Caldithrix abyssi DSM 13497]|uniref:Two component regulator propeller n=1 Tax=Caldithrix abyssi DSM 13497 TaxID=880073 RepID=H1XUJ2_CALAY|nr:hypothetical protein [Caldithrix abyssi]APF16854.1 hypothetical protein Cabys_103 [Caldithrix abyssi DSM 13497]EHO40491.1 hypothetical protein Calab_0854 [Caldithrix abyssi DSM 13497]